MVKVATNVERLVLQGTVAVIAPAPSSMDASTGGLKFLKENNEITFEELSAVAGVADSGIGSAVGVGSGAVSADGVCPSVCGGAWVVMEDEPAEAGDGPKMLCAISEIVWVVE